MKKLLQMVENNMVVSSLAFVLLGILGVVAYLNKLPALGALLMLLAAVPGALTRYVNTKDLGSSLGAFLILANGMVGELFGLLPALVVFVVGMMLAVNLINLKGDTK